MSKKIKVGELFAGVGGFRIGMEKASDNFKIVFANQWEPNSKAQYAFKVYEKNFGENKSYINKDIANVNVELINNKNFIPDIDLLVGGFPCQDYSVATVKSKGIEGIKGVLWWEIVRMIEIKKPSLLFFENVDRLLKSPKNQKGRDFLIMLKALDQLGYSVEWRVINAADYGNAQRRKRIYIIASNIKKIKDIYKKDIEKTIGSTATTKFLSSEINKLSDIKKDKEKLKKDIFSISRNESFDFMNYGTMNNSVIQTANLNSLYNGKYRVLNDILQKDKIDDTFYLSKEMINKIKKTKEHSKKERITKEGFKYFYTVGKMNLIDWKDKPSRTMLTSEGTINRSTHLIEDKKGIRYLSYIEAERLNGFKDNWTKLENVKSQKYRYFLMGNALVIDIVKDISKGVEYLFNI